VRGSPSCASLFRRSGGCRVAPGLVAAATLSAPVASILLTSLGQATAAGSVATLAAVATLAPAAALLRLPAATRCRKGPARTVAVRAERPAGPSGGAREAAIDPGAAPLPRFRPGAAPERRSTRWLRLGRRVLEREWHSFRCAVYSPRPGPSGAADPPLQ
jgi:hypothetical protein